MKSFVTKYGILDVYNNDTTNLKHLINGLLPDQELIEKYLVDFLLKSTILINVGSGIGAHDLLFTKMNPSISIYSFEPREEYFYILSKNLAKNNIENVIILNNALGHITGPIDFTNDTSSYNSSYTTNSNSNISTNNTRNNINDSAIYDYDDLIEINLGTLVNNTKTYHLITLDSLHLLQCNIIFIDLDGFGYSVLIGGIKTIKKYKPIICYRNVTIKLPFIKEDENSCKELLEKLEYSIIEYDDFIIAKPIINSDLFESKEIQNFVNITDNFISDIQ